MQGTSEKADPTMRQLDFPSSRRASKSEAPLGIRLDLQNSTLSFPSIPPRRETPYTGTPLHNQTDKVRHNAPPIRPPNNHHPPQPIRARNKTIVPPPPHLQPQQSTNTIPLEAGTPSTPPNSPTTPPTPPTKAPSGSTTRTPRPRSSTSSPPPARGTPTTTTPPPPPPSTSGSTQTPPRSSTWARETAPSCSRSPPQAGGPGPGEGCWG